MAWVWGFSIAQSIVDAHHGRLTVTSETRVGTTFLLIIPFPAHGDTLDEACNDVDVTELVARTRLNRQSDGFLCGLHEQSYKRLADAMQRLTACPGSVTVAKS